MKAVVVNPEGTMSNSSKIKNCVLFETGGKPLADIEYCGVCHTDLHVAHGDFGKVPGRVLRHEGIGIVKEIAQMSKPKVGDRGQCRLVLWGCGALWILYNWPRNPLPNSKNAGYSVDGGMAEQCIVTAGLCCQSPWRTPICPSFFYHLCRRNYLQGYQRSQLQPANGQLSLEQVVRNLSSGSICQESL